MPAGDGTGPAGAGPMTGRALGYCAGFGVPGYLSPGPGFGFGMGFGRGRGFWGRGFGRGGRGWRHWYYATGAPGWMRYGWFGSPVPYGAPYAYPGPYQLQNPDPDQEKQALKTHAEALQSELESIKKRLGELESGAEAE